MPSPVYIANALVRPQFGRETLAAPGTVVPATKQFAELNVHMEPAANISIYNAQGVLVDVAAVQGEEWAVGGFSGPMDANELPYLLDIFVQEMTGVVIGTSTVYTYTAIPSATLSQPKRTWTVEWGDRAQAAINYRSANVQALGLTIKGSRKALTVEGNLLGQLVSKGVTMTAAPTTIPRRLVVPNTVDIVFSTVSQADLATQAALTMNFEYEISFGDRLKPFFPVGILYPSFGGLALQKGKAGMKLTVGAGGATSASDIILQALRNGDMVWCRFRAIGPQIGLNAAAPVYSQVIIDMALQVSATGKPKDQDGVYAWDWEFIQVPDAAWSSQHLSYAVQNILATL